MLVEANVLPDRKQRRARDVFIEFAAAHDAEAYVAMGVNERDPKGSTVFNTLLYFGPDGNLLGKHRKLMPTGGERLAWGMGDGSTMEVFETEFGRLGGLICWENYMPLARAAMYAQGVDIWITIQTTASLTL